MAEAFVQTYYIQKKIDSYKKLQMIMKIAAMLNVLVICLCNFQQPGSMKVIWFFSIPFIIALIFVDASFIKKQRECEYQIYQLELKEKEEAANKEIGETAETKTINTESAVESEAPSEEISLPILYYGIVLVIDIVLKIAFKI